MARGKLLRSQERRAVFGLPTDDNSLIRHYTLSPSDLFQIQIRRRPPNQLGFAGQLWPAAGFSERARAALMLAAGSLVRLPTLLR